MSTFLGAGSLPGWGSPGGLAVSDHSWHSPSPTLAPGSPLSLSLLARRWDDALLLAGASERLRQVPCQCWARGAPRGECTSSSGCWSEAPATLSSTSPNPSQDLLLILPLSQVDQALDVPSCRILTDMNALGMIAAIFQVRTLRPELTPQSLLLGAQPVGQQDDV